MIQSAGGLLIREYNKCITNGGIPTEMHYQCWHPNKCITNGGIPTNALPMGASQQGHQHSSCNTSLPLPHMSLPILSFIHSFLSFIHSLSLLVPLSPPLSAPLFASLFAE